jgi:hypothetical protein
LPYLRQRQSSLEDPLRYLSLQPDITVAIRLDPENQGPLDYYLLPRLDFGQARIHLAEQNAIEFDSYRFETLDYLYGMAGRTRIRRAA